MGLESLPFPVAHPLSFALDDGAPIEKRLSNTVFASYQAMRLVGLVLLADYFACSVSSPSLASAIRGLRTPHWSEWSVLCDRLATFWSGEDGKAQPDRETYFPDLVSGWKEVNRKKGALPSAWAAALEGLPGLAGLARNPNDALWKARNDLAHRRGTLTTDDEWAKNRLFRLLPLVDLETEVLFPAGRLTLVRILAQDPLRTIQLTGPHQDLLFIETELSPLWSGLFEQTWVAALGMGSGIPLYPLIVSVDSEGLDTPSPTGLTEQIALLEGSRPRQLELLGVRRYYVRPDLIQPFMDALAQKDTTFGLERRETLPWALPAWAEFYSRETLDALRGRKYFPECYLERCGVDDVAAARLQESGKALLVLGEAGSGKSSLLANLAEGLLQEKEVMEDPAAPSQARDTVIFLSGQALTGDAAATGRQLLTEAVLARAGIRSGAFTDLTDFAQSLAPRVQEDSVQGRKVWIILDALNEADRFTDILKALDDFLPSLGRHPWLRLAFSIRSGAWLALRKRHEDLARHGDLMENSAFLHTFRDESTQEEQPFLEVRPFTLAGEGRAAYEKRQQKLPSRASKTPYDSLSPSIKSLLLDPLHLHLFHEAYQGQTIVPAELEDSGLFAAYLGGILDGQETLTAILDRIGKWMFKARKPELPLDITDEWIDSWRKQHGYDSVACVSKLDPIEELVAVSLLLRPSEEGFGVDRKLVAYQFSHQKLCEQVLLRYLKGVIAPRLVPTEAEFLSWARHASVDQPFAELIGALATLATEMVAESELNVLGSLLEVEDEVVRTAIVGPAIRAVAMAWGPTEQGEAQASLCLSAIAGKATMGIDPYGERFEASVWREEKWLVRAGFKMAAQAINLMRLQFIRVRANADPTSTDIQKKLSNCIDKIGKFAQDSGRFQEAMSLFKESIEIDNKLVRTEPNRVEWKRDLSTALSRLGDLHIEMCQWEEASSVYQKCFEIDSPLVLENPHRADVWRALGAILAKKGFLLRRQAITDHKDGALTEAKLGRILSKTYYESCLEVRRKLVRDHPPHSDLQLELALILDDLGSLLAEDGASNEGAKLLSESLKIKQTLVDAEPYRADFQSSLLSTQNKLKKRPK